MMSAKEKDSVVDGVVMGHNRQVRLNSISRAFSAAECVDYQTTRSSASLFSLYDSGLPGGSVNTTSLKRMRSVRCAPHHSTDLYTKALINTA
jgi:hypothetical protein